MNKITIIGGGVAGASTAIKLAEKTEPSQITLIDKKTDFNKACSGILTFAVDELIKIPKDVIVSKVEDFKIIAPNGETLELRFKKPDIVCERAKLNEHLNNLAFDKGVNILRPAELINIQKNSVGVKTKDGNSSIPTKYLVGADGAHSTVAKLAGIYGSRKFFVGAKAIIKKEHDNAIEVYPGIGCFSWVVPHGSEHVEAGAMSYPGQGAVFDKFLKQIGGKAVSKEGAMIPVHNPLIKTETVYNDIKTYLIGDSAAMVKATTGGSIIQSFIASQCLAESIAENKKYCVEWRKKLGIELFTHLQIRKTLDKLTEKEWSELIKKLESIKDIMESKTRDNSASMILKILLNKPSLLRFGFKMFYA